MSVIRQWASLASSTFRSLNARDVGRLYSYDWPQTRKTLIADFAEDIEGERRRLRRFLRTTNAMFLGLARKLAPERRVLYVAALFVTICGVIAMVRDPIDLRTTAFALVSSFLVVSLLLAMELIDKIKFRDELELARDLQSNLIPKEMPAIEELEIEAANHIANTVGGDIYDFVVLPDGRVALFFGDASGHGMAAGLVMAVAHAAFRTQIDVDPDPAAVITSLNRILLRTSGKRSFFACAYFLVEKNGSFRAIVAGHPPVLLADTNGRTTQLLGAGSYPLGIKESAKWEELSGAMETGDSLVFYSDGIVESRDPAGNDFGYEYLQTIVQSSPVHSSRELMDRVLRQWSSFTQGHPPEDDISIAVVRRRIQDFERRY